jgi:fructokinase
VILVCGEALMDVFVPPDGGFSPVLKATVGGSPLNVATGLARLGVSTAFFGSLSTDHFGSMLAALLRREGIDTSFARPTPLVLVAPDADGHPSYTFYAHQSAECDVDLHDVPHRLPPTIKALALGSYTLSVDPIGTALLALAEREATRLCVSLDFNLRPAMAGALDRWRDRVERFARCATIIKFSEEDFKLGWGNNSDIEKSVRRWLAQGAQLVVMTCGAYGATAWHHTGRIAVVGIPVHTIDSVGAGDSFHAGLLARLEQSSLLSGPTLKNADRAWIADALHYATVTASITCGRKGADMPSRREVDAAL